MNRKRTVEGRRVKTPVLPSAVFSFYPVPEHTQYKTITKLKINDCIKEKLVV